MKKYLAMLIISLLVLSACSPAQESTEANIVSEEEKTQEIAQEVEEETVEDDLETEETMVEDDLVAEEDEMVEEATETSAMLELTLEELKEFNGSDGKPAYIAIEGKIYDVTNIPNWNGGNHNGFEAGNDLTLEMSEIAPHGLSKLSAVEEIGIIVE